jgi:hypothetical protein
MLLVNRNPRTKPARITVLLPLHDSRGPRTDNNQLCVIFLPGKANFPSYRQVVPLRHTRNCYGLETV